MTYVFKTVSVTKNFDLAHPVGTAEISGAVDFDGDALTIKMEIIDPDTIALLSRDALKHISIGFGLELEKPPPPREKRGG